MVVLDGVGVGAMPDADEYGDEGSATLQNIYEEVGGLSLPNMAKMGLGEVVDLNLGDKPKRGGYGKFTIASAGKDSTTGHWEMMGLITEEPFPVFPDGFPDELISRFEDEVGRGVIGNVVASGTEIIEELGEEHLRSGKLIVYTSADSVFQIAAHKDIVPVDELYEICRIARRLCKGEFGVGRVIARPFIGKKGSFERTPERKDFSLPPPEDTVLDLLIENDYEVRGVGKLDNLFAWRGFTSCQHTTGNAEGMSRILELVKEERFEGLLFSNLLDFDMLWGHRNDVEGFAKGLVEFDEYLPKLLESLRGDDILIIVSDHGNDPTTVSTDHSREYCMLLVWYEGMEGMIDLGKRETLADLGATIVDNFELSNSVGGCSFFEEIVI